jgi:hypothetical protein
MKTVYLTTVLNSFQAYLLKDILSQEGIVSFMRNETISSVYSIPGMEIEILVFEDDYERAKEIYEKGFPDYKEEDIEQN